MNHSILRSSTYTANKSGTKYTRCQRVTWLCHIMFFGGIPLMGSHCLIETQNRTHNSGIKKGFAIRSMLHCHFNQENTSHAVLLLVHYEGVLFFPTVLLHHRCCR